MVVDNDAFVFEKFGVSLLKLAHQSYKFMCVPAIISGEFNTIVAVLFSVS